MAKYHITNGNLYKNGVITELNVLTGSELKVQSTGSGSYKVIGKLTSDGTSKVLNVINLSTFDLSDTIRDNGIYVTDVSGLYSISVSDVSGVNEIYGTIYTE